MTFTALEIAYIALAAVGTAMVHSVGGFAGALLLAVAIAPIVGIKETVPVVAAAMVISHSSRVWLFRKAIDWRTMRLVLSIALPFIILGILLYLRLPEAYVAIFLGAFLLFALSLRRLLAGSRFAFGRKGLAVVAVPYGFLAGTSFGSGMILGPFLLGAGMGGEALIATIAALGLCLNAIKTVAFGLSPLLTPELAGVGFLIGLCTIPGHWAGRWVVRRTPIRLHAYILEAFMLGGAAHFLWKGVGALGVR